MSQESGFDAQEATCGGLGLEGKPQLGPPAIGALFLQFRFWGEGETPTKIDYRKKGYYSNLSPGVDSEILGIPSPFFPGKPPLKPRENGDRFLRRTMVEQNGQGINP